ncbi:MAG: Ppx/GppA family phosphatase [Acidobacteriia bacterium]|nr:Ppx/GppA family phosphatase [Terriglobia bacterium]
MSVFAAVDIGSNSVRLKIARVMHHRLEALHEDRVVTRLGESVFRSGVLSPEAMDATVSVLRRFHRTTQKFAVDRVRVVATSALRDARNAAAFVAWVRSATGWKVETVSGLEEGRLIHLGLLTQSHVADSKTLLVDLGGGSCELTISERGHIRSMASLPLGAVRLTEQFLPHDPPWAVEVQRLREDIGEEIDAVRERVVAARVKQMLATSGTAAALAGAARSIDPRRRGLKGGPISRGVVLRLAEQLARLDAKARARLPGINPRRAEIIVAGAFVFAELMERCALPRFRYSPLGLRDGILAQILAEHDRATSPRRRVEEERQDAILAMCRQYGVDVNAAESVRRIAVQLFRDLRPVHDLPAEYESWLSAAAALHDVGSFINRNGRHRHTHYLISSSELFGFTPEERQIIAAIARYLGKSRPDPTDGPLRALAIADQERVPRAVALLRLAKAMNPGHGGRIAGLHATADRGRVVLRLSATLDADLEVWMLQKERAFFREVFGRNLVAEVR